jgi:hypothetical protein
MKKEEIKKFLLGHLEKLAFAAALIVILVYLISLAITTSDAERESARADEVINNLKERESRTTAPEMPSPGWFNHTTEPFKFVPKSECQITWFVHKIPFLPREVLVVQKSGRKHFSPDLTVEPQTYSVKLKWQKNSENHGVQIVKYTIKRIDPQQKEVVVKVKLPSEDPNYEDSGLQPYEKYTYWIEELAEEDPQTDANPLKEEDKLVSSEKREVTTKSNIDIDVRLPDNLDNPTKVMIKVTFTKPDGNVPPETVWVGKGEEIVWTDTKTKQEIRTGWTVIDLVAKEMPPVKGKRVFVTVRNAQGKEQRVPPE